MAITGSGGPRRYRIGDVMFSEEVGRLEYWPAKSARILQCVAAVGLALVLIFLAALIWRTNPLSDFVTEGDQWNSIATALLVAFAGLLLLAVPLYLRDAKTPYVLEPGSTILRHGRRNVNDFQGATEVSVVTRKVGEAGDIPIYSVALTGGRKPITLPLLAFDQKADAHQIATKVSAILELPVV